MQSFSLCLESPHLAAESRGECERIRQDFKAASDGTLPMRSILMMLYFLHPHVARLSAHVLWKLGEQ